VLLGILLSVVTLVVYVPCLRGQFVFDDRLNLENNLPVRSIDGLGTIWFGAQTYDFYPVVNTVWWIEWHAWRKNTLPYHLVNVALHITNALLIWRILLLLGVPGAWLAAMIFAVHPVNVSSVAWITELKNCLSLFVMLCTAIFYLDYRTRGKRAVYFLAIVAFLIGGLCKGTAVMLPFAMLLYCLWKGFRRRDALDLLPFFVLGAAIAVATVWFQQHNAIGADIVRTDPFAARLAGAGIALWFYIGEAIWPAKVMIVHPIGEVGAPGIRSFLPLAGFLFMTAAAWRGRQVLGRGWTYAIAYFAIMLFPVLGFFNIYFMRFSIEADHWQYHAVIAVIATVVVLGIQILDRPSLRAAGIAGATICIALLAASSWRLAGTYQSREIFWREALAQNSDCWLACNNLAAELTELARYREAEPYARRAVQMNPQSPQSRNCLAEISRAIQAEESAVKAE
jgi:hypothetical protein